MKTQQEKALARIKGRTVTDPETGCQLWTGGKLRTGYGSTYIFGRKTRAHRAVWELVCGPIPLGAWVLHRCDRPACVNENHLFIGDVTANNRDMAAKGRHHEQQVTTCPAGHSLTGSNVRRRRNGARICVTCQRAHSSRYEKVPEHKARINEMRRARRRRQAIANAGAAT